MYVRTRSCSPGVNASLRGFESCSGKISICFAGAEGLQSLFFYNLYIASHRACLAALGLCDGNRAGTDRLVDERYAVDRFNSIGCAVSILRVRTRSRFWKRSQLRNRSLHAMAVRLKTLTKQGAARHGDTALFITPSMSSSEFGRTCSSHCCLTTAATVLLETSEMTNFSVQSVTLCKITDSKPDFVTDFRGASVVDQQKRTT